MRALLIALLLSTSAHAVEIKPSDGVTITLGNLKGVMYYTVEPDGYRVVVTISAPDGVPARVISILTDGQALMLSTPRGLNEQSIFVEIVRKGDAIIITPTVGE